MASKLALDPRVDPRIKAVFAGFELPRPTNVASREEMLAEEGTEAATAKAAAMKAFLDTMDTEMIAPSAGLSVRTERFTSSPDGNSVNIQFIRPANDKILTVRLLYSRWRHGDDVLLLRQLPRLGPDDRGPGRRGGHGRFS
jgi:acetyl esterase